MGDTDRLELHVRIDKIEVHVHLDQIPADPAAAIVALTERLRVANEKLKGTVETNTPEGEKGKTS